MDAENADLRSEGIAAMLCVSRDMQVRRGWSDGIDFMHVGLVDGPGNRMSAYHAAALAACGCLMDSKKLLIVDHVAGGRAIFAAIAALNLTHSRLGWEKWLDVVTMKTGRNVPIHNAHRSAFNRMNWKLMATVLEG